jgi:hypothetical protein
LISPLIPRWIPASAFALHQKHCGLVRLVVDDHEVAVVCQKIHKALEAPGNRIISTFDAQILCVHPRSSALKAAGTPWVAASSITQ